MPVREEVRLSPVVGALSVASDLAKGLPNGQALHACVLGVRLAEAMRLTNEDIEATFWVGLLRFVGCTATASDMARRLGDEIAVSAAFATADPRDLRDVLHRAREVTGGRPLPLARLLVRAPAVIRDHEVTSCEVAQLVADRLRLPTTVGSALRQVFERWDGRGNPGTAAGTAIAAAVRVAQVAHFLSLLMETHEGGEIQAILRERAGSGLDPHVVEVLLDRREDLLDERSGGTLADLLAVEPRPHRLAGEDVLDEALAVFGAVADMKSPYLAGHSAAVAELASSAAVRAGLPTDVVRMVHRAGLVHDVGRVAVSSRVWDRPGPLSAAEWEMVRLHPHHSGRVLAAAPALNDIALLAVAHHERRDGSGYPRGESGPQIGYPAALLAAADVATALSEPRPHRPAYTLTARDRILAEEVRAGRLHGDAVAAVVGAGQRPPSRPYGRDGRLTPREHDVLKLVARGSTNRQVASQLGISSKTVNAHLEHIYRKLGVSSRAAAAFHAVQSGLMTSPSEHD